MATMLYSYTKYVEENHIRKMVGNRTEHKFDTLYHCAEGDCYYYRNRRGYYHILYPSVATNKNLNYVRYDITDYKLTAKGEYRVYKEYHYNTAEELRQAYKNMVIESGGEFTSY